MNYIKNRFFNIKNDKILLISIILTLILVPCHWYQWHDSGSYQPLIRMIFCAVYPFLAFFFGRNGFYYFFWVYGNFLAITTTFQNYTSFVILCIFVVYKPKFKWLTLGLYLCEIIFIATYRHKTPIHIAIHLINCAVLFFMITKTLKINGPEKLDLLPDEIKILQQLAAGCSQKEIDFFSPNTVCSKLKAARLRNDLNSNDELLLAYMKENDL